MIMFFTSADYFISTNDLNVVNGSTNEKTFITDISKEWFDKLKKQSNDTNPK